MGGWIKELNPEYLYIPHLHSLENSILGAEIKELAQGHVRKVKATLLSES